MKVSIAFQDSTCDPVQDDILSVLEAEAKGAGHEIGLASPETTAINVDYSLTSSVPGNSFDKTVYKCEVFAVIVFPGNETEEIQATDQREYPTPTTPRDDASHRKSISKKCARHAAVRIIEVLSGFND
ncbi:hypothetical protein [Pseudomonas sp. PDM19]|uniref:hypothetical protein n=1 Tax=Pseudomonas sp. PDM19 TaxID=2769272 RepID=UPI0017833028|nr:hypothetical protein [Pseudomonas sp. PDM19]MBD9630649.1 hypothetical protein [Pseudomonas sp. PDM19]